MFLHLLNLPSLSQHWCNSVKKLTDKCLLKFLFCVFQFQILKRTLTKNDKFSKFIKTEDDNYSQILLISQTNNFIVIYCCSQYGTPEIDNTKCFKYDRDWLRLVYTQFSPGHIWTALYIVKYFANSPSP